MGDLSPIAVPVDSSANEIAFQDGADASSGSSLLAAGKDSQDYARTLLTEDDGTLKVASQPPSPPSGTTEFILAQDDANLEVGPSPVYHETESAVVGNGVVFNLQLVVAGAAGDPSERGSKVELFWREGAGPTDHLITRVYLVGASLALTFPSVSQARDGTAMIGNGTNTKVVLVRTRLSTAAQEIDAEVRGFLE
jgi:hypothetical protein